MKNRRLQVLFWVLALLPALAAAVLYRFLPEQIPMHWSLGGEVEYSGKGEFLIMTLLSPALAALLFFLPRIDPRKRNYVKFQSYYDGFCIFMMLFLLVVDAIVVSESFFPGRISVGRVITVLVAILFLFLGNIMPKIKPNFYMGFKTPWTLSNSDVWMRTHRLGGLLFFVSGLVMLPLCFVLGESAMFITLMVLIGVSAILPIVMSLIWYLKLPEEQRERSSRM